jgi:protein SCO1/2
VALPRRATVALAAGAGIVALAAAALVLAIRSDGGRDLRAGTPLDPEPAPAISLEDQSGRARSLAALRGRVVVVTFLFTSCPDVCPLTADKLAAADRGLGDAGRVAYVAVSLDPEGDTPEARREFVARHRLPGGRSFFLNGPRPQLESVWADYGIGREEVAARVAGHEGDGHTVMHTDVMFLVDAEGNEREVVRSDVSVADLVADLAVLLDE